MNIFPPPPNAYFFSLANYAVPNWLSNEAFLQGLGLTQSLPGPLFNFAAYIGAAYKGVAGALLAWVRKATSKQNNKLNNPLVFPVPLLCLASTRKKYVT